MEGYIKLFRELIKKPIWLKSTPEQKSVLITILLMANFYENEWEWKGEKFNVIPGQFVSSLESIRKHSGLGISIQNVRSSLKRFEKLQFLTNKSTKSGRLITILNWHKYQLSKDDAQQSSQQRPNKEATKTQHLSKNDKNEIKKEKDIKKFIPPSLDDVISYFKENGYNIEIAKKAYKGYSVADWYDSSGKKIKNWKQKMHWVWFKDENKVEKYVPVPETPTPEYLKELVSGIGKKIND